ncbi:3-(3-hydroxyphenyl)propionate hydroxylase [Frankia canadensis]|uniref:3-(3-hydroxyphenyl)propionate hydroxylase n=1 Tax=Frankia canadensis TaxID=1836972 RepID=A0A2I2L2I5_9ACTN|nr:3-(3-hydroxyphenyl)propionate hydroxylase [Frankia canadensis]SOU59419.1 3-(3-hydroxyphenyl)propionate hydroxylase [Frankia canadensis]
MLVVGYGPVGAVLAALLGERGVSVLVVDPATEPYPLPRAAGLEARVLRLLLRLPGMAGLLDDVLPSTGATYLGPDRRPLLTARQGQSGEFGVPVGAFVYQPSVEQALRAGIATMPSVRVRLGAAVRGLRQDADGVSVDLDDGGAVAARWVIGCDGTTSTVRSLLGVGYDGTTFAKRWLVVDVRSTRPLPVPSDLAFVLDPERPAVTMPVPGGHRWEWMLLPGEETEEMSRPQSAARLLASWIDPDTVTIDRQAVYTFHARMAHRWRVGRVLLAGDAAHTMPPFTGQGLNAGIRDAAALAWRLTEVLAGLAAGASLDDYERERRPEVAATTSRAVRAGRLIQATSPTQVALTRTALRTLAHLPGRTSLPGSGAAWHRLQAVARPRRESGRWAGTVLPNPAVRTADGTRGRLEDLLGPSWALLGLGVDPAHGLPPAVRAWARGRGATLLTVTHPGAAGEIRSTCNVVEDLDGTLLRISHRRGEHRLVVIRPDRQLLGAFPTPLPAGVLPG